MMKTYLPDAESIERDWFVVDADEKVLGRLASRIAKLLMGKHKPIYTDFLDTGDFVVVVNADRVRLTGDKWNQKVYYRHSGKPGALKEIPARRMRRQNPERVIELAVKRMLPKNKLGSRMLRRLKVYAAPEHPHEAQQPKPLDF